MTDQPTAQTSAPTPNFGERLWHQFISHDKFSLTAGGIVCGLLVLGAMKLVGIPEAPGRAGSVLQQTGWPVAIALLWVAVLAGALITSVISSQLHYDGSLFCAGIGLAALSVRLGPSRFALFAANSTQVYIVFCIETLLLYLPMFLAWKVLHSWSSKGVLPAEHDPDPEAPDETLGNKILAAVAQAMAMTIVMLILSRSDAKLQSMASVFLGAYLGTLASHSFVTVRPSCWYFAGPLLVALVGYLAQFVGPVDWVIGDARGALGALARPLPLDYAGLGTCGALMGYWTSLHWAHNSEESEQAD